MTVGAAIVRHGIRIARDLAARTRRAAYCTARLAAIRLQ
jgi:hypothetical protein